MKNTMIVRCMLLGLITGAVACKKDPVNVLNTGNFTDTTIALKDAGAVPVGTAIDYSLMLNNAQYAGIVKRDFNSVTFGYQMKHGAIVQNDGTLNFTKADELVAASGSLAIFGHTLGWHENQNASYLKNFAGIIVPAAAELASNPGFESGLSGWSAFNTGNPAGNATITAGSGAAEVHAGNGSMKVINPTAYPGSQWRVQVSSGAINTVSGKQYIISYWVKAAAAGGSIRLSTGPTNSQYQGDQTIGTSWQQVSWTITANLASTTFLFDMGQAANTYYIDDVSMKEAVAAPSGAQVAAKLDIALENFVTNMVTHYKGKVKAWDVVNELFADDGSIRNNTNSAIDKTDVLVWSNYMGRDYALKAFNYAKAADPDALLFINDYGLESRPAKLDSLIKFVAELKTKGAKVDGIGTQMHIAWNTPYAGIDAAFQKLAATGLKIRISELDVRVNPSEKTGFAVIPTALAYQADMYRYVINSYLKNVPAAQRHGITIWGVSDLDSWIITTQNKTDAPLLYDKSYGRKPAYAAVLQELKKQ